VPELDPADLRPPTAGPFGGTIELLARHRRRAHR
jgi:hypothetical protein